MLKLSLKIFIISALFSQSQDIYGVKLGVSIVNQSWMDRPDYFSSFNREYDKILVPKISFFYTSSLGSLYSISPEVGFSQKGFHGATTYSSSNGSAMYSIDQTNTQDFLYFQFFNNLRLIGKDLPLIIFGVGYEYTISESDLHKSIDFNKGQIFLTIGLSYLYERYIFECTYQFENQKDFENLKLEVNTTHLSIMFGYVF